MKKENDEVNFINRKWISIIGFIISIILLTVAIVLSAKEEKIAREAKVSRNQLAITEVNNIEQASSKIGQKINEVEERNLIITEENHEVNTNITNENAIDNQIVENNENKTEETQYDDANKAIIAEENSQNENKESQKEQFIKPVEGENITNFSMDSLLYSNTLQEWITHRGIDIKADKTTVVKASADGTVKSIKEDPRYGLSITIEHDGGFQTVYSSLLSSEFIKEGDKVTQGQSIGTIGNSAVFESAEGSHLHFEMLKDGEYVNPDIYIK